jgi:hypothetical protein
MTVPWFSLETGAILLFPQSQAQSQFTERWRDVSVGDMATSLPNRLPVMSARFDSAIRSALRHPQDEVLPFLRVSALAVFDPPQEHEQSQKLPLSVLWE